VHLYQLNRSHDFFIFRPNKIHVKLTDVVSSLSPPRCHISSHQYRHAFFPLSQDEHAASASSFDSVLSRRLTSRAETEALNLYHCHMLLSLDCPTLTIHCYKKIISILITLHITQPHLYFASSLSEFHLSSSLPFTTVSYLSSIRTTTSMVTN
jgi:hypothetical protein